MTARILPLASLLVLAACGDSADTDTADVAALADAAPVSTVQTVNGSLAAGDDTLVSGEFMDSYEVVAREGQWIWAEVVSTDFDPYFLILSPTGVQTDIDDSSLGNTSMTKAVVQATESGAWTIVVTSYEPGEAGAYELTYDVVDERPDDADEGQQVTAPDSTTTDA